MESKEDFSRSNIYKKPISKKGPNPTREIPPVKMHRGASGHLYETKADIAAGGIPTDIQERERLRRIVNFPPGYPEDTRHKYPDPRVEWQQRKDLKGD